jgi:hypothetical protein
MDRMPLTRPVDPRDVDAWSALRARLWPDVDAQVLAEEARAFADGYAVPVSEMRNLDDRLPRQHVSQVYCRQSAVAASWFVLRAQQTRAVESTQDISLLRPTFTQQVEI